MFKIGNVLHQKRLDYRSIVRLLAFQQGSVLHLSFHCHPALSVLLCWVCLSCSLVPYARIAFEAAQGFGERFSILEIASASRDSAVVSCLESSPLFIKTIFSVASFSPFFVEFSLNHLHEWKGHRKLALEPFQNNSQAQAFLGGSQSGFHM